MIGMCGLAFFIACSNSSDTEPQPTRVAPAARPTATATAIPTPVPTPTPIISFENSLGGSNLTKFLGLPVEFRDSLVTESKETDNDQALEYLHDLPNDAVPITELLDIQTQEIFDSLHEGDQRQLLLEGYPNASPGKTIPPILITASVGSSIWCTRSTRS